MKYEICDGTRLLFLYLIANIAAKGTKVSRGGAFEATGRFPVSTDLAVREILKILSWYVMLMTVEMHPYHMTCHSDNTPIQ